MVNTPEISNDEIENLFAKLNLPNQKRGYFLNPDQDFTKDLIKGLLVNQKRYGYQICPCRLTSGSRKDDLDVICPCAYRDADVAEYGNCYCGLYVSKKNYESKAAVIPIPERRPNKDQGIKLKNMAEENSKKEISNLSYPVWRCEVCGYICARTEAPDICPICGASQEQFEKFI